MHISNIELRHLRYFLAVAEELNFSRAALRLHISQPPLSQQIREMEERLETKLFMRSKRKVELTNAGRALVPYAKKLLREMENGLWAAHAAGKGQLDELRIGTIFSAPLVPAFGKSIQHFRNAYPSVRLVIQEMRHAQHVKALNNNEIDLAFTWQIAPLIDKKFKSVILSVDPLYLCLPATHRLAIKKQISIADLAEEPLLLASLQTKMPFFYDLQQRAAAEGVSLRILEEASHFTVITNLVAANIGLGILPEYVARLATQPLVRKNIKDVPRENMQIRLALTYRSDNKSEALAHFIKMVS